MKVWWQFGNQFLHPILENEKAPFLCFFGKASEFANLEALNISIFNKKT
jgi:hypothetical protein